jgi:hypothetical protein
VFLAALSVVGLVRPLAHDCSSDPRSRTGAKPDDYIRGHSRLSTNSRNRRFPIAEESVDTVENAASVPVEPVDNRYVLIVMPAPYC